ncbi:SDR family NAD(P)-dependent oxidoreductase [Marinivivus vitaminiproducens]|uniref:SDR family NAD(P)-dependent oxidoreductase n=1 Tax=Marinivivus vitaminiproducens TaxID=3035935 RepID=UPI0027A9910A|nr:SDR family oxidoreductase [Geminicoccaceae bacterium SCSIO 64248]
MTGPILIFGATGGIGAALARRLSARGLPIHLAARDEAKLSALADELGAPHSVCDVLDADAVRRIVETAAAEGALGGLAYAVGSIVIKPLGRASADDFLDAFRLNALGAALAVQAAARPLAAGNGSVLLFSTVAVGQGFPNHSVIASAKGAVEGLIRSLAAELAPKVRVNGIAPSLTRTPLAEAMLANPTLEKAIGDMHPLPRLGEPDDIAALGAYLLSDEAGWTTGQVFGVDGGRSRLRVKD